MGILYLTPYLPYPPTQGAAMRNWHILRHAAQGRDVGLVSFVRSPAEERGAEALRSLCRDVRVVPAPAHGRLRRLRSLLAGRQADMAVRLWSPAFAAAVEALLADGRYQVVQAEAIEMAPYLWQTKGRSVFDEHNAEYLLQWRAYRTDLAQGRLAPALYSAAQFRRLATFERRALYRATRCVAVSAADRAALRRLAPGLPIEVIPNAVDTTYYTPAGEPDERPGLVFTGAMGYRPNVDGAAWFCREVLPRVRRAVPGARLTVAGRGPAPAVRRLGRLAGVEVTGEVTDIRPWIGRAQVAVVPLRMGSGTRLKLMEAMAMGRPVVSTTVGAEGLPAGEESGVILADSAEAFAEAVVRLLCEPALRRRLGQAARRTAVERLDWRHALWGFDRLYESLGV